MALSETNKADVRRHLGYGPVGDPAIVAGTFASYRYFQVQGLLEFRLFALSAQEQVALVGSGNPVAPANPNFIDPATSVVYDGYLNICNFLEGQIATATDNLDTEKAGRWTARKDEVKARQSLYFFWCRKMAQFLYLPMGYAYKQNFGSSIMQGG